MDTLTCRECGTEFKREKQPGRKPYYCSAPCSLAARRVRKAEQRKRAKLAAQPAVVVAPAPKSFRRFFKIRRSVNA